MMAFSVSLSLQTCIITTGYSNTVIQHENHNKSDTIQVLHVYVLSLYEF